MFSYIKFEPVFFIKLSQNFDMLFCNFIFVNFHIKSFEFCKEPRFAHCSTTNHNSINTSLLHFLQTLRIDNISISYYWNMQFGFHLCNSLIISMSTVTLSNRSCMKSNKIRAIIFTHLCKFQKVFFFMSLSKFDRQRFVCCILQA